MRLQNKKPEFRDVQIQKIQNRCRDYVESNKQYHIDVSYLLSVIRQMEYERECDRQKKNA